LGYHYTVVSRIVRKHTKANTVKDLSRSGRPHVTSKREDTWHCIAWSDRCHSQPALFWKR